MASAKIAIKVKEPTVAKVKLGAVPKPKTGKITVPKISSSQGLKSYIANSKANLFS